MRVAVRRQPRLLAGTNSEASTQQQQQFQPDVECVATGMDVMCEIKDDGGAEGGGASSNGAGPSSSSPQQQPPQADEEGTLMARALSTALLISPFFFWGSSMVAMKVWKARG